MYACFIDYEKAFDRVDHQKLIDCLKSVGMRGKDIRFIRNLYWNQEAYIRLGSGTSDKIKIKRGVRQGCILSPLLFILYTEMIFRAVEGKRGVEIGGMLLNNLRYADDTVLLAESKEQLQELVNAVDRAGLPYGMKMNAKKTKTMVISRTSPNPRVNIRIGDNDIDQVQSFTYLGHLITDDGKSEKEIYRRIAIAKGTFNKMSKAVLAKTKYV